MPRLASTTLSRRTPGSPFGVGKMISPGRPSGSPGTADSPGTAKFLPGAVPAPPGSSDALPLKRRNASAKETDWICSRVWRAACDAMPASRVRAAAHGRSSMAFENPRTAVTSTAIPIETSMSVIPAACRPLQIPCEL
jgi:hypothetical protein